MPCGCTRVKPLFSGEGNNAIIIIGICQDVVCVCAWGGGGGGGVEGCD